MATDFVQVAAAPKSSLHWSTAAVPGKFMLHQKKKKYVNTLSYAIAVQATAIQNIQDKSHMIAM